MGFLAWHSLRCSNSIHNSSILAAVNPEIIPRQDYSKLPDDLHEELRVLAGAKLRELVVQLEICEKVKV